MTPRFANEWCTVYEADCRKVAEQMEPGSFSLAILDGPYGMGKAAWDRVKLDYLAEWYRPHLEDVGRLCGDSASLYVWNTAAGLKVLHPLVVSMGWTWKTDITWDKGIASMAGKCDTEGLRGWYDVTEVCGFYQREAWAPNTCAGSEIAYAAGADDRNTARLFLLAEWAESGLPRRAADIACNTPGGMATRHYFPADQWALPTWEAYQQLAAYAQQHGAPRERPYLVLPQFADLRASYDHLRAEYDHLRAEYDHLRAEYEASRPAFNCPIGVSNVWSHSQVSGSERLRGPAGSSLHPCQKPLTFADRMIRASSRPGERVWAPFGGTLREALAATRIGRADPAEARHVVTCELNQDGVDYLGPAIAQIEGTWDAKALPGQVGLFGGAR